VQNSQILQVLVVIVSAPLWLPMARTLLLDTWRHAEGSEPSPEDALPKLPRTGWRGERSEVPGLFNAAWGAGRGRGAPPSGPRRTRGFRG